MAGVLPAGMGGGVLMDRFAERRPRIANFARNNSSALLNFGLGMLSGGNRSEAWGNAQQGMAYGAQADQARRQRTQEEEDRARQEEAVNQLLMSPEFAALPESYRTMLTADPELARSFVASQLERQTSPAGPPQLEDFWNPETDQIERRAWTNGQWVTQGLGAPDSPLVVNNLGADGIDYGDPPANHAWARDANRDVMLDERGVPIALPIGPALADQQAAEAAGEARTEQEAQTNDIVLGKINEALGQVNGWTAGLGQQVFGGVGGTGQYDLQATLETIGANIAFDALQAMREASPTGGALGQVTERELALLQATAGNIDPRQSPTQLRQNLQELQTLYLNTIHGAGNWTIGADGNVVVGSGSVNLRQPGAAAAPPPPPTPGTVMDGYRFNGGDPADQNNWTRVP